MRQLLESAAIDEGIEELDHSPWITMRRFEKDGPDVEPSCYGPFDTPAEALTCADTIQRQMAGAALAADLVAQSGKAVFTIVPLYSDYGQA